MGVVANRKRRREWLIKKLKRKERSAAAGAAGIAASSIRQSNGCAHCIADLQQ